ncbi:MAG: hypothetical protein WCC87_14610 [Candidatus Korobacteraceae bacterium]
MAKTLQQKLHTAAFSFVYGVTGIITFVFYYHVLPPFRPYPYADDWIYQTPLQYKSLHQYITWAFSQHVDHRIPVQLASNFLILRASGFDFRYLVGLNFALACLMTVLLLYIAQRYRGYQMFGDVIIPLTTLSFGAGYTIWGFQFQFLSSTFFLTLFIFCCVLFESSGRQVYLQAAAGSLLLCSLCGMNGLVASSCATVAMMGWLLLCRVSKVPVRQTRAIYLLLALNLVVDIALWASWKPSEVANVGHFNVYNFGRFIYCILPSCFVLYSFTDIWWKSDLVLLLLLGAVVIFCLSLRRWRLSEFSCFLGIVCSIAVLASVAVGRSKLHEVWDPALGMHYGYLSILIPLLSWVIISSKLPTEWTVILSLVLIITFGKAFQVNAKWRFEQIISSAPHQREVVNALESGQDPRVLSDKYALDFTFGTQDSLKRDVAQGINAFRQSGARLYGGHH